MNVAGLSLAVAAVAYLLGSIPFGFLLVLLFRKEDIRTRGSGNIGATNVVRSGAKGLGALTFLLDAAKGFAAVLLVASLTFWPVSAAVPTGLPAIAAVFAVLGHMYPVWLRFRGGKGVATAFGVFLALSPRAALLALAVFIMVLALWRYVSLASLAAAAMFPVFALLPLRGRPAPLFLAAVVCLPLLVIAKHRQNIRRLLDGSEYRFGKAKAAS